MRDKKEREREEIRGKMKYLGGELKCQVAMKTQLFRLLIYSITEPVFQPAGKRRRINAPLLRAIALALRKFAANSTPASPVYENEWKLHCKIKHGFWIMKLLSMKHATADFSTKWKRTRKWRNIIFKYIRYARWLACALEILICVISNSNLRQTHWKKSCLSQMR